MPTESGHAIDIVNNWIPLLTILAFILFALIILVCLTLGIMINYQIMKQRYEERKKGEL